MTLEVSNGFKSNEFKLLQLKNIEFILTNLAPLKRFDSIDDKDSQLANIYLVFICISDNKHFLKVISLNFLQL